MSSWIDDALLSAAVRQLFTEVVAARPDLERHGALPPSAPDPAAAGYWQPREATARGQGARPLSDLDCDGPERAADQLAVALRSLWTQPSPTHPDGLPELAALVSQITALATRLRSEPSPRDPDGSYRPRLSADAVPALVYPLF